MNNKAPEILNEAIRIITGLDDAAARPSQYRLMQAIDGAMSGLNDSVVAQGRTGVGKSLAYLSPSAYAASLGERTVISTESLALQAQIADKDAPTIAEACERMTGYRPSVAVLKGFNNYACAARAVQSAEELLGREFEQSSNKARAVANPRKYAHELLADLEHLDPDDHQNLELVKFAIAESVGDRSGDKFAFGGDMTNETWDTVSIASAECVGPDSCPFADICMPRKSRTVAAAADIVVTNHTMLGVQAAKGVPVVIGNRVLGEFENVVVDEAHALPSTVRNQGSAYVSGQRMYQLSSSLNNSLDGSDPDVKNLVTEGQAIGDLIESELSSWAENVANGKVVSLGEGQNPLTNSAARTKRWIKHVKDHLDKELGYASANEIRVRRLKSRFDDLNASIKDCSEHQAGTARWVEMEVARNGSGKSWPVVRYTPVDVSGPLMFNVWTAPEEVDEDAEQPEPQYNDEGELIPTPVPRRRLNVICVSATLPVSFCRDVGLKTDMGKYESPFEDAFSKSAMFVPRAMDDSDVIALCGPGAQNLSKPKLNTRMHTDWAADIMCDLVEANGGSALVLSATAASGRIYAEKLRASARGRFAVLSQWDPSSIRNTTQQWKDDPSAVLVGTRSLMTGVDAPGATCSLVIVDRIPRAASNPVDDARVEKLIKDADYDKWTADRIVYGGDATLLLEQAAGRLIRSTNDSGMVAVLDPRLLRVNKGTRMGYPAPTRDLYLSALEAFDKKISDHNRAAQWLREHKVATA